MNWEKKFIKEVTDTHKKSTKKKISKKKKK